MALGADLFRSVLHLLSNFSVRVFIGDSLPAMLSITRALIRNLKGIPVEPHSYDVLRFSSAVTLLFTVTIEPGQKTRLPAVVALLDRVS